MDQHSRHDQDQLDKIQDDFRHAWEAGERPEIKTYMPQDLKGDSFRIEILKVLIPIDIEFRAMSGDVINSEKYADLGDAAESIAHHFFSMDDTPGPNQATLHAGNSGELEVSDATTASNEIARKTIIAGKYKLIHEIGSGGMGTVWLAQQEKPVRRQVALKVIRNTIGSREALIRFEAERQALAMMNHPNIAHVLDAGTMDDGAPFFVMELVKGQPLTQYCNENRLTIRKRLELLIPVCNAIQHAHQKGIIHRDIKPTNILVSLQADIPTPKVIDFGLAKAQENQTKLTDETMMTEYGRVLGTLQYMSPEQAGTNNLDVDARTDIFSLGVVLYQLLTSTTPLDRKTIADHTLIQIIDKICRSELQRPSVRLGKSNDDLAIIAAQRQSDPKKLVQQLAGELDWIALKALDRDRTHRYQTAKDLADDIQRHLDNEPVSARPPSQTYLLKKFIHKYRGWVASALLATALLIGGTFTSTYFAIKASRLQNRASKQLGVYKELFASTNPLSGASKEMSTAELLEKAENDVMALFDDDPTGKAELLHEIGRSYSGQRHTDNAISTLQNAWRIAKKHLGVQDPKTLTIQESLAIAYSQKDVDKMLELMQEVYDARKGVWANDSSEMMNTRHLLATASFFKFKEKKKANILVPALILQAKNTFEENLQLQSETLGPNHEDTLKTTTNLSNVYLKNGDVSESIELGVRALQGWQQKIDSAPDSAQRNMALSHFLTTKNNYAEALQADGQIDRAIEVYLETLQQKEDRYDVGHGIWRTTLRLVMAAMHQSGQSDRALQLFNDSYNQVQSSDRVFKKEEVLRSMDDIKSSVFTSQTDD